MKKTINRMVSGLLCLVMVLCILPQMGSPAEAVTGYDRGYNAGMEGSGRIVAHGLDVSAWQESGLDFRNIANAGYDYVILRIGTSVRKDVCFEEFYTNAKAAGLDVGCYYYSYATTVAQAQQEARDVVSWMQGKCFEYPIYFDFEDPTQVNLDYTLSANICRGFMDILKDNGYLAGLYSMSWILNRDWVYSSGIYDTYEGWVAHVYSDANNTGITSGEYNIYKDRYSTVYGMHQYSFTTYVNGVGPFDANVSYKDYPTIMKTYGFNGYKADNWERDTIGWRYKKDDGTYAVGWTNIDNSWYYFSSSTYMFTGWHKIDGEYYFFSETTGAGRGRMQTGWVAVGTDWYYCNANGIRQYGWQNIDNAWYYLKEPHGIMAEREWIVKDGEQWYVNAAGDHTEGATWTDGDTYEGALDIGTEFYATIDISATGTRAGVDSDEASTTYKNLEVQAVRDEEDENYEEQLWYFVRREDGSYRITNVATGLCLDVAGGYVDQGTNVRVWEGNDAIAQRWFIYQEGNNYGMVAACNAWNKTVLDIADGLAAEGTNIRIWPHNGSGAQQFMVTRVEKEHTYEAVVTAEPTADAEGVLTRTCSGCGDTTTVTLPKLNKTDYTYTVELEPTATMAGVGRYTWNNTVYGTFSFEVVIDPPEAVFMLGDVDFNGVIDTTDYILVKAGFLRTYQLSERESLAADVDQNGVIDATDYLRIKAHFLGTFAIA